MTERLLLDVRKKFFLLMIDRALNDKIILFPLTNF